MLHTIENDIKFPTIPEYDIIEEEIELKTKDSSLKKSVSVKLDTDLGFDEVAVIGDIHGTSKFIDGYENILKNNNNIKKIIVMGDHFDPYINIPFELMVDRFLEFLHCLENDNRIISLIGNHDLSGYILKGEQTNRTELDIKKSEKITELVEQILPKSRLVYQQGDFLFSHAGVSDWWVKMVETQKGYDFETIKKIGWTDEELLDIVSYYPYDCSGWGDDPCQSPVWIRPQSLIDFPYKNFNQVVGHTKTKSVFFIFENDIETEIKNFENFYKIKMKNNKYVLFSDNDGESDYLIISIKK